MESSEYHVQKNRRLVRLSKNSDNGGTRFVLSRTNSIDAVIRSRVGTRFHHGQINRMLKTRAHTPSTQRVTFGNINTQYGFTISPATSTFEASSHEQEVIRFAHSLRSQKLSLRAITKEPNIQGYTGRTGKPFQLTQITRKSTLTEF